MAITMSSGKSRSMAAVLLLVAVVACTCAAGVQAQSFTITNSCSKNITITTGGTPPIVTVPAGATVTVPTSATAFFVNPVKVTIVNLPGSPNVVITIPPFVINFILLHTNLGLQDLVKIEIRCVGNSILLFVTYQFKFFPGFLLPAIPFGPYF